MIVKQLIKLLRNVPANSAVQIALYHFDDTQPQSYLDIVHVEHCECCNTVKIAGLLVSGKPELDAAMEEALAKPPDQE